MFGSELALYVQVNVVEWPEVRSLHSFPGTPMIVGILYTSNSKAIIYDKLIYILS